MLAPLALTALLSTLGCREVTTFGDTASPWCDQPRSESVACVVDGDTLDFGECEFGERVRLLGVDTPEVHGVDEPECFGEEASAYTKSLLPEGTRVILRFDLDCQDTYERTLAYVFLPLGEDLDQDGEEDELFINEELLAKGYARWFDADIGTAQEIRYRDVLLAAEAEAQDATLGLWDECE